MENDVKITYQVMGRQQITQNMIHDYNIYIYIYIIYIYYIFKYILIISLNKCENKRI